MKWILILIVNQVCPNDGIYFGQKPAASTIGTFKNEADCLAAKNRWFREHWPDSGAIGRDILETQLFCVEVISPLHKGDAR